MCIRYYVSQKPLVRWSTIINAYIPSEDWEEGLDTFPGYIAPIVVQEPSSDRRVIPGQWGLIPHWAKEASFGKKNAYNARAEGNDRHPGIENVPTFRDSIRRRRCLIPAEGFYERFEGRWQWITLNDRPVMGIAGLWEPGHLTPFSTYAMVTTEPNSRISDIHDRMPMILDESDFDVWLSEETSLEDVIALLKPYPPEAFQIEPRELVSLKAAKKEAEQLSLGSLFDDP